MKYLALILMMLLILNCSKEIDKLPRVYISIPGINEGDTLAVPIYTTVEFCASSNHNNSNLTYSWDYGDNSYSNKPTTIHSYSSTGLYKAVVKVNNGDKEGENYIYVKVVGLIVGDKSEDLSIHYIKEFNSDLYVFSTGRSGRLLIHKIHDKNTVFVYQPLYFDSYIDLADITMDHDNNFILLQDDAIGKIDINGETITKKNLYFSYNEHLYLTADNNYLCIGRNNVGVAYEKRGNKGELITQEKVYDNKDSDKHCLDAAFINDNECLLLFNEGYYEYGYYPPHVSIAKRNLTNLSEVNQAIPDFYCHSILNAKEGFLIYGFEIQTTCDGCDSYLDIVKVSTDMKIEWKQKINLGNIYYNPNDFSDKVFLREYEDTYKLFYGNKMFSITKSGNLNTRFFFDNMNFQINAVGSSGENTILAGINKQIYFIDGMNPYEAYPVVIKINKQGSIID